MLALADALANLVVDVTVGTAIVVVHARLARRGATPRVRLLERRAAA